MVQGLLEGDTGLLAAWHGSLPALLPASVQGALF